MSEGLIIGIVTAFAGSGLGGFFLGGRSKQKSDFLLNVQTLYNKLSDDLAKKQEEYQQIITKQEQNINAAVNKIHELEKKYVSEQQISKSWEKSNKEQKIEINRLLKINNKLTDENKKLIEVNKRLTTDNQKLLSEIKEIKEAFEAHKLQSSGLP